MRSAGVSTSAGIPDFRSPKTGLYSNLARLNLPHPEAVFEINFFRRNPVPFYTLAAELYPGAFRPTPTHSFIKVLASQGLLHTCFTQNIDTLERRAGIPAAKIVEAHGSFATQRCINCKTPFDDDEMREIVLGKRAPGEEVRIPRCKQSRCGGLVKPDIVFFGESCLQDQEQLPDHFIEKIPVVGEADLLIVIGTSLTVHPFASLARMADSKTCRRVLINLERVGDIGKRPTDLVLLGDSDTIVRELCIALGWEEELDRAWAETVLEPALKGSDDDKRAGDDGIIGSEKAEDEEEQEAKATKKELEKEVERMAEALGKRLDLGDQALTGVKNNSNANLSENAAPLHASKIGGEASEQGE
ncbi:hypothetical protein H0H81_003079 [Sphagnurus paluster]|uniref:NAD-dependent protein deacetylase n=1 Tax=Sphagnurus paluster TaxID=117069 RepID=A0A9P7KJE7_9AGAR|nr:hypothetical protein H0H81_003079 [Sphagnurus paluster]